LAAKFSGYLLSLSKQRDPVATLHEQPLALTRDRRHSQSGRRNRAILVRIRRRAVVIAHGSRGNFAGAWLAVFRRMRRELLIIAGLALAACGGRGEVVGPFTGQVYRFRIDALAPPQQRSDFAADFYGEGREANWLAIVLYTGFMENFPHPGIADMIGSGALHSIVEIQTDDPRLRDDPTVGVTFRGSDGAAAGTMGAPLANGHLATNPIRYTHTPVAANVSLPAFGDSDPWPIALLATQVQLTSDGHGGFDGILNGAAHFPDYMRPLYNVFEQVYTAHPRSYGEVWSRLDANRDGTISFDEFTSNDFVKSETGPDLRLLDAAGGWAPDPFAGVRDALSVGFWFHLVPCADDACTPPPSRPTCKDRVRNGDETDVDCGGSCGACQPGLRCNADADCQTRCIIGTCALPTCNDGVLDGFETDVDCGLACKVGCASGRQCIEGHDCASGVCSMGGTCS
jgi:hypothetical protein